MAVTLMAGAVGAEAPASRIINGHPARTGEWPWMVSIYQAGSDPARGHFCGGALVHPSYVLTAAHCVWEHEQSPRSIRVLVGGTHLSGNEGISVEVDGVIPYPAFTSESIDNDIALLRLKEPVSHRTITPVRAGEESVWTPGTYLTLLGWGMLDPVYPARPDVLQQASIPRISDDECRNRLGLDFDPVSMLCAGRLASSSTAGDGIDACLGDSGGPLMVATLRGWRLIGLVSWGFGCGGDRFWGVYTRLAGFSEWLDSLPGVAPYPIDGPVIEGAPRVGETVRCVPGEWGGDQGATYSYEWLDVLTGTIQGEKERVYTLRRRDIGARIVCSVTATNGAGARSAETQEFGPIFPKSRARLSRRAAEEVSEVNVFCQGSRCSLLISTHTPSAESVDGSLIARAGCAGLRRKRCDRRISSWRAGSRISPGHFVLPLGRARRGTSYTLHLRVRYDEGPDGKPFPIRIDIP